MKKYNNIQFKANTWTSWATLMMVLLCMMVVMPLSAQNRTVQGTVIDDAGKGVVGASIRVSGTNRGTITDINGAFSIEAARSDVLAINFVGYEDAEVIASDVNLRIKLTEESTVLDDLVFVGYGTQTKKTLTGAIAAVSNKEITITKNENVVNMLAGKVPGLRVSQNSSQPGEYNNRIDIRGMGSPLIVVDGIPRDQGYFSRMDANEIDDVTVLKDASAAIYGIRAANGVILVTTKRGTSGADGKFDITFTANYGWQQFLYVPQTASAVDHMLLWNEKVGRNFNGNYLIKRPPGYTYEQMLEYSSGEKKGTSWTNELFDKTSPQQQYNVSVSGSTDKVDVFFNLGYLDQMGAYTSKSLNYDRWNFRGNIDARITKRLTASLELSGFKDEKNQPFTDIWSVYKKAWTYRPTSEAWVDGDRSLPAYDDQMLEAENPVAATDSDYTGYRREKRYNFNGTLSLTYDIPGVEGLKARAFYSYDYSNTNNSQYKRAYNLYNRKSNGELEEFLRNSPSTIRRSTDPGFAKLMQAQLQYNNTFGDHTVGGLVLFEQQYNTWDGFYAARELIIDSPYLFVGEEENQVGSMGGVGDKRRQALIGRFNYDYQGKYMADFSFRYDGSSSFPSGSRWGFFSSISGAWRISEESFIKDNISFLDNLKLRASYGKMGDDGGAGNYPPNVVGYNVEGDKYGWFYGNGLMTGVSPTSIPNPDLTWFTAKTVNIGLDFDLWNQKLYGTFELFRRKRDGLLATSSIILPGTVGANMPQENVESDRTFGWEISLGHRNRVSGVSYFVEAQISATKNRWDHRLDSDARNSMEQWRRTDVSGRNKDIWFTTEEGGRFSNYNQIYNHPTTGGGVYQGTLPGDYWYKDWNNDGVVDGNDSHPVATFGMPVFNYGITMGVEWKGIDLSMNWQGAAGVYQSYDEVFTEVMPFDGGAALTMYLDRWRPENVDDDIFNPNTKWIKGYYPATGSGFSEGTTGIKNTSYIRLKTLELGYTLPKQWVSKVGIKNLRVYFNAYNLLTITGLKNIDPERPGRRGGSGNYGGGSGILFYNYPVNRTYNVGVNITF